jgi:hypothetical protein
MNLPTPPAETPMCRLSLVFPAALETRLHTCLQTRLPAPPRYTVLDGEGHGIDFAEASVREQIRGRVELRVLVMLLPEAAVAEVLAHLRADIADARVQWWTESVLAWGSLG